MHLSIEEQQRYSRHLNLPEFGMEGQRKLKAASVLVVGTGGLGAPLLQYLCAAGVGIIGVVDFDKIDKSNLQRQVLFDERDVGKLKSSVAIEKLRHQNPHVQFVEHAVHLSAENAMEIIQHYDIIADGTDNFPTRYLINDACYLAAKPYVYASIYRFEGQVSVFNLETPDGRGPNYRDLYPAPPPPGQVPSCAEGGVLGVLPGIIGSIQALEVIKVLCGIGEPLSERLMLFDALSFSIRTLNIRKDPKNPLSGENVTLTELIDYEGFCGLKTASDIATMSVQEWFEICAQDDNNYVLIDVRENYEYEAGNMSGWHIPLDKIEANLSQLPKDKNIVLQCKSGARSLKAAQLLQKLGYVRLYNLKGGIQAWQQHYAPGIVVI